MKASQKETLKKRAAVGVVTLGVKRVVIQVIYTVSNIFLARLLFPADFGTFAIVTFMITFFTVFSDLGLGPSLVQKKQEIKKEDLQTAFTFQLILSLILILAIYFLAPAISAFYNLGQKGIDLFRFYSLIFLAAPVKTTSGAILERNLDYKKLVIIEIFEIFATSIITVAFAIAGLGVFSFAIGVVVGHLIGATLYFRLSPWPFGFTIVKKNLLTLAKFGLPLQTHVVSGLFFGPLILLYLGKMVGSQNLGFYQFAASLSALPMAIPEIITRIIFPLGAKFQQNKAFFRQIIERSVMITSATSVPVFFVLIATAPVLIHFVYTDRWLPALPAFYLNLAQMVIISYTGVFAQLLLAKGKAAVMRNIGIFWAILTWIITPPLIYLFNFVGMSLAGFVVSLSGLWLIWRLKKEVDFSLIPNFSPFFPAAIISGLLVFILINLLSQTLVALVLALAFGAVSYCGLVLLLARKVLAENFKLLVSGFTQT